jgi:DNA-binding XRE family transcriptional regulator
MRQADLAGALGMGRSTLANVERGAERPSERLWWAIKDHLPHWTADLEDLYAAARSPRTPAPVPTVPMEGGPFEIVSVSHAYLFKESLGPEEVIEVRRVRATEAGATAFGLRLDHADGGLQLAQEVLWGGAIESTHHLDGGGRSTRWTRVVFGRSLRVGQVHEFAVRTRIEHDPEPRTEISLVLSLPAREASVHVSFQGSRQPSAVWAYGPAPSDAPTPISPTGQRRLKLTGGTASHVVRRPEPGHRYGMAWDWAPPPR